MLDPRTAALLAVGDLVGWAPRISLLCGFLGSYGSMLPSTSANPSGQASLQSRNAKKNTSLSCVILPAVWAAAAPESPCLPQSELQPSSSCCARAPHPADVECRVVDGGTLGSRRHLNIRGKSANLPAITDRDWEDIKFGVEVRAR